MMKSIAFLLALLMFCTTLTFAQKVSISGTISDSLTGERLIGANIYIKETAEGTTANSYGYYTLAIGVNKTYKVRVSFVGYNTIEKQFFLSRDTTCDFVLSSGNELQEVTIVAESSKPINKRNEAGVVAIPMTQMKRLPAIGGEGDVLKALQMTPGIKQGNEGSSGIFIRGGSPDQNLMILDDVPLYYVNHLGGFVSLFNSDAINDVKVYKGGFPARYGSRLSSVVDIRMKDGNMREFQGNAMIGMITCKIAVEGPLKKDKTSYLLSVRRFMYDIFSRPISRIVFDKVSAGYSFYDINFKLNHVVNTRNRLLFSVYHGNDNVIIKYKEKEADITQIARNLNRWGNSLVALRWNHVFGKKIFNNLTATYTRYHYTTQYESEVVQQTNTDYSLNEFNSGIYDFTLKSDVEYYISNSLTLRAGVSGIYHNFKPGIKEFKSQSSTGVNNSSVYGSSKMNASEGAIYCESDININSFFSANLGFRYSGYFTSAKKYTAPEPRILVNFSISKNSSIKVSYAKMYQYVHLLTTSGTGMPTDLWMPSNSFVQPSLSNQYTVSYTKMLNDGIAEFSADAYYKQMNNLISYKEGVTMSNLDEEWYKKVEKDGKGRNFGIELFIHKKQGRLNGWVGYTYSRSLRQFSNLNKGKEFAFSYDRPHDFSIVGIYKINTNIDISASWVFASGKPITLAIGKYYVLTDPDPINDDNEMQYTEIHIYEGKNTIRMKPYHRLDIGISFRKVKKWGERTWNISVYNAYNRLNPYYYYFAQENYRTVLKQFCMFPIMPSISYNIKF